MTDISHEKNTREKLIRISAMLNQRTIDKIGVVQKEKNCNTRTAALIEIINAYNVAK